jgi:hypothetical protein
MAVWVYKVISSGKGGFATPALLESFLNQLGTDEWEIVEFRGQPDNPLAFSGLARRSTQRDWTLEDAAAAAARAEADKLRQEFEAKFKGAAAGAAAPSDSEPQPTEVGREVDGLRRLRDTERDADPDAQDTPEDEWDKIGSGDELPTFFEAMRPHMRRNQRGPGFSVGVDYLAKKWDISEDEVLGALKECGLEIPEDEDAKIVYVEYDGDVFWVNVNRRGELWVNTKEKSRPVFKTVKASRIEPEEPQKPAEGGERPPREERRQRDERRQGGGEPESPAEPLPEGNALLERIKPLMRRNRRDPGASGSMSFLSRALRCSETSLVEALSALGLKADSAPGEPPVYVDVGADSWWLNRDNRGSIWINGRNKDGAAETVPQPSAADQGGAAPGNVLAAVRLLLKETKTGSVAAKVERLAGDLGKTTEDLIGALTLSGLRVPGKAREKPVFVEHAGEIFWLNLNAKGELWLNAKASKYADGDGGSKRRAKGKKKDGDEAEAGTESPAPAA